MECAPGRDCDHRRAGGFYTAEEHSPVEAYAADAADMAIQERVARTLDGLRITLWVALAYTGVCNSEEARREHVAILTADAARVATFAKDMDFEKRLIFSAILSVTDMIDGGSHG